MYVLQVEQEGSDHHIQKKKNYLFLVKVCTLGEGGYEVNIKVMCTYCRWNRRGVIAINKGK